MSGFVWTPGGGTISFSGGVPASGNISFFPPTTGGFVVSASGFSVGLSPKGTYTPPERETLCKLTELVFSSVGTANLRAYIPLLAQDDLDSDTEAMLDLMGVKSNLDVFIEWMKEHQIWVSATYPNGAITTSRWKVLRRWEEEFREWVERMARAQRAERMKKQLRKQLRKEKRRERRRHWEKRLPWE